MAEYNVILKKKVLATHSGTFSEWDVWVRRDVRLPFVPTPQIALDLGDGPTLIQEVTWSVEHGYFTAWVEPDEIAQRVFGAPSTGPDFELLREHIDDLTSSGWTVIHAAEGVLPNLP